MWKFAAQIAAALIVTCYGGVWIRDLGALLPEGLHLPGWIGIPLTVIVIVGATNAINLSDGLDGLAGGISIMSFICIAYLAYLGGDLMVVLLSIAMIGAIFGFLRFNTYPATLFMGDAGSQFLGFWAISLSLKITQADHGFNRLLPMMLLGMPILDTISVMLGRIASGKSPFMPDKNHLHHRFMKLGLSHSETVFLIYALQACMVTSAYLMRTGTEWLVLASCLCFGAAVLLGLAEAKRTGWLVKRHSFLETLTRSIKNRNIIIKTSFKVCETGLALLLGFNGRAADRSAGLCLRPFERVDRTHCFDLVYEKEMDRGGIEAGFLLFHSLCRLFKRNGCGLAGGHEIGRCLQFIIRSTRRVHCSDPQVHSAEKGIQNNPSGFYRSVCRADSAEPSGWTREKLSHEPDCGKNHRVLLWLRGPYG